MAGPGQTTTVGPSPESVSMGAGDDEIIGSLGPDQAGQIVIDSSADILLVDDTMPLRPRIVAVIAGGRLVPLTEANRLVHSFAPR